MSLLSFYYFLASVTTWFSSQIKYSSLRRSRGQLPLPLPCLFLCHGKVLFVFLHPMDTTIGKFVRVRSDHSFKENILPHNLNIYHDKKSIISYFPISLFLSQCLILICWCEDVWKQTRSLSVVVLSIGRLVDIIITCCLPPAVYLHGSSDVYVLFTWSLAANTLFNNYAKTV